MRRVLLAFVVGITLAASQLHPMWNAEWMVRDDHGLLAMIGTEGKVSWGEVLPIFASTTSGRPGRYHRYQPVAQIFAVAEAAVFGPQPRLWHVSLTVMFAFILGAFWWVSSFFLSAGLATLLTAYVSTHWYWHDVFLHLFDGEKWGAVWLAVFAVAAVNVWRQRVSALSPTVALCAMAVSGALAAGSKENMLILLPLYMAVLGWSRVRARVQWVTWTATLLYLAASAVVVGAVLVGLRRGGGMDEYGNPSDIRERLALLLLPLPRLLVVSWLLLLGFRAWALRAGRRHLNQARNADWMSLWRTVLVVGTAITVVILSQFLFYNGKWPTQGGRYDFPGRMVEPVLYVSGFHFLIRTASIWKPALNVRRVGSAVLALWLLALTLRHSTDLLRAARIQAAQSHREGDVRRAVAARVVGEPDRPVVMLASELSDWEAAFSFSRLLRVVECVPNPIFLYVPVIQADTSRQFVAGSLRMIRQLSSEGGAGFEERLQDPILPWSELAVRRARGAPIPLCVALHAYKATEIAECPSFPR